MSITQNQREAQQERINNAKRIMARVLQKNPGKGYDNPTAKAGSIFSALINDYMLGRPTSMNDLVNLHSRMQPHGSLDGTTFHSIKRVMAYLVTIANALESSVSEDLPEVQIDERPDGTYEVTFC